MSETMQDVCDSSFEELANKTIEEVDRSTLGCFEDIAVESFQELEKYNEETLSSGDLQRLLEKTRQRREVLNQKLGKTPDVTPRKRILEQNLTRENVPTVSLTSKDGSPGKRQCVRDEENIVHPDTPAINGVKSRMQAIARQRENFSEKDSDLVDDSKEIPMQTVTTTQREAAMASKENTGETVGRRGRFAHLAQTINNWEDDLSHPTIHKPEEPKPRWQPPKPDTVTGPAKPPRTETNPSPPQNSVKPPPAPPAPPAPSPKKTYAPQPPISAVSKVLTNTTNKNIDDKTRVQKERTEDPTTKSVSERLNSWKASETPKKEKPVDPSEQPVSAKKAVWEQKISTPTASVSKVQHPVRQMATPVSDKPPLPKPQVSDTQNPKTTAPQPETQVEKNDPAAQPVSARMASWQQRISESTPKKEEEPTAYSVTARMSAWEEMSSSNKVSYIKKVDPGSVSPGKKSPVKAPVFGSAKKPTPVKAIGQITENKAVTPTKAVKDHLMQKADHIKASMESPQQTGGNPGKIGSATKMMQQKLFEQVTHGKTADVAEQLRKERMEEVQRLQHRHQNGILKEGGPEKTPTDSEDQKLTEELGNNRREEIRMKARTDDNSEATYDFKEKQDHQKPQSQSKPPIAPGSQNAKSKPSPSIYRLISQKRSEKPSMSSDSERKSDDSFDSTEDEELYTRRPTQTPAHQYEEHASSTDDGIRRLPSDSDSDAGPIPPQPMLEDESDCDDVSFSAFVPASVRRQSVLPSGPHQENEIKENKPKPTVNPVAPVPSSYRSGSNLVGYQQQSSLSSLESTSSEQSSCSSESRQYSETEGDDSYDSAEINDFLDEAMSDEEERSGSSKPRAAPRKRRSHMMATSEENAGNLVYSVSMYRSRRYLHEPNFSKKKIIRNREFEESIHEENIEMPTQLPPEVERKSIQERIQELQELVGQEQSVIMQTSNALNQCCSSNSYFQGSPEQVECNRLLLIACQKRQAYLTEIQRLKETGCLDPPGSGPRGSLTISDIRLPLKKEFVTKIGTASDNTVHYFLLLIRNHAQVIVTQMLSTHDPMMRGSLDFPNLIKIHGISGDFRLNLEIYSMSISREAIKDKKRKTPKKAPKGHLAPAPSPGGPMAVRTTSFTLITTLPITMRALDKTCFTLERIPYLSPLHGTIYMRLKCLMEQNVEERGFLTMFEDVSGFGAWHRRWSALQGNKLCFWKYPDEETRKEPMGIIDLKRCVTEKIGLIPRDICARPNTFELVTVRQPRRGEEDTLVSKTYNTMTSTRHMISADTKEERINWCNKINRALANIRTWHSDALRPIKIPTPKQ